MLLFTEPKVLIWDRWRCVWHPRRHIPAWWWVSFLKGFLLASTCQDKSWKSLFYIISSLCFVLFVGTLMVPSSFFFLLSVLHPLPNPHWFKSYWWTWLVFLPSPRFHFLTCCLIDRVLVCTHTAFDYRCPPPPPPSAHTRTHKRCTSLSPLTAVIPDKDSNGDETRRHHLPSAELFFF